MIRNSWSRAQPSSTLIVCVSLLDREGRTALHVAVQGGYTQCIFLLLELGGTALAQRQDYEGARCFPSA